MRHSDNGKIPLLCGYGYSVGKVLEIGSTFIAGQTLFPTKEWYYLASKIDSSSRLESFSYFLEFVHEIESSKGEKEDSDSDSDSDLDNDEDSDKDSDKDLDKDKDEDEDEDRNFGSGWLQWPKTMRHMALHMKDGVLPFKDIPFDQAADGLPPSYRRIILDHLVGEGNLQDGAWYDKVKEDSQPQPLYII
ncbi:hypothetical protein H9Q74_009645 [Fusarium xylarioides]|nr:hypothetical protein H9Q71_010149 [Fusarium xylarioides]KAG5819142.1 hypothetical protein H9Q74_009645 [Fusarium xylarioides]